MIERSNITLDGRGHTLKGSGTGTGIQLSQGSRNVTINNLTISDFIAGIWIYSSRNTINGSRITCGIVIYMGHNTISNNTISEGVMKGAMNAIYCFRVSATTIINNNIEGLINIIEGGSHKISGNRITGTGIHCKASSSNIIQRNLIFACSTGISFSSITYTSIPQHPKNNLIVENEIIHCTTGLSLGSARNTTIWHNNLIDNTNQASGGSAGATWDNSYPSGGNFWSDYVGKDFYSGPYQNETGSDQIGDTPYPTKYGYDQYPLIERYNLLFWKDQRVTPKARFTVTVETSRPAALFNASASKPGWTGTHLSLLEEYSWQFGDGNTTSANSFSTSHIYPSSGTFTVLLTVTDDQGLKGSNSRQVHITMPTTISVQTNTPSSPTGFSVDINGTLQDYYGNVLKNQEIVSYYTFPGIDTRHKWMPIISAYTDANGDYAFEWIPSATGHFTIRVLWNGNNTHLSASITVSYASITHEEHFIAVESNSTISHLSFDAQNRTLMFKSLGQNNTDSYTRVTIPKTLVADISKVEIYVDGIETPYNSKSLQDSYIFEFAHASSLHEIEIQLPSDAIGFLGLELWVWVTVLSIGVAAASAIFFRIFLRRKGKRY